MSMSMFNLRGVLAAAVMTIIGLVSGPVFAQTTLKTLAEVGSEVAPKIVSLSTLAGTPDALQRVVAEATDLGAAWTDMQTPEMKRSFPNMNLADIQVLGKSTKDYNCIAWSLGLNKWVNPITDDGPNPLDTMDTLYELKGYKRQPGGNFSKEPGVEKVVVYAKVLADGHINVTHAARQDVDGTWTSKLGRAPLIRHKTPEALNGPVYGQPVAVYVRKASQS